MASRRLAAGEAAAATEDKGGTYLPFCLGFALVFFLKKLKTGGRGRNDIAPK